VKYFPRLQPRARFSPYLQIDGCLPYFKTENLAFLDLSVSVHYYQYVLVLVLKGYSTSQTIKM